MGKLADLSGSLNNIFQLGLAAGVKTLRFSNGFNGDLQWNPTANRVLTLPDTSGVLVNLDGSSLIPGAQQGSGFASIPVGQEAYYFVNGLRQWGDRSVLRLPEKTVVPTAATDTAAIYAFDESGVTVFNAVDPTGFVYRLGADLNRIVRNSTGATLTKGTVVYINGAFSGTGILPTVAKASTTYNATTPATPAIGVVAVDIPNNTVGRIIVRGRIDGINTLASGAVDGQRVFLGVDGVFTATAPSQPNYVQRIGIVLSAHASNGSLLVDPQTIINTSAGTSMNAFSVGDALTGTKTLKFLGNFTTDLTSAPTANRTIALPNASGTLALTTDGGFSNRVTFSNADYTVVAGVTTAAQTGTLTAARTVTLPAASSVAAGTSLTIVDESGSVTQDFYIAISRAGTDTINGLSNSAYLLNAYGYCLLESNGTNNWVTLEASDIVVQFSASGSLFIPNNGIKNARFVGVGSGAGGGSGRRGATATVRGGGGGGACGGFTDIEYPILTLLGLGSSFVVTIPAGGTGGAAIAVDDTNGSGGGNGGTSTINVGGVRIFNVTGGFGGSGGTTTGGTAGGVTSNTTGAIVSGAGGGGGGAGSGSIGGAHIIAGAGGGGGGGSNAGAAGGGRAIGSVAMAPTTTPGGGGAADGGNALNGSNYEPAYTGYSGGGGGGNGTGAGGNGGTGARGSGGGGGGASLNGFSSGAGGAGGPGFVRIFMR